ncbi:TlpA family protein disulfide reductase [Actinoallomurus purpureus]|uniref:TlpA disulfide reductase family protein n=1 Tax=Actinoallomurus purpureus TaxID=478114 RepID=UPI002091EC78|nr:TlpA disulfide reductase family protein [Actinoallomurus purpureus]MCO6007795.1 TlpA family protein disulfide reductase [Actinoallomurus purpureus]
MPYLAAAVVLIGLLCVLNLILTLGLIRRLRGHGAAQPQHAGPPTVLKPGSRIGDFATTTTEGEPVSHEDLIGLVGFFSAGCEPCHDLAPRFARLATGLPRLAVVTGDDPELVTVLSPAARVVVEDYDGVVSCAFQNTWTPALYLIDAEQRVVATGGRLEDLPVESPA